MGLMRLQQCHRGHHMWQRLPHVTVSRGAPGVNTCLTWPYRWNAPGNLIQKCFWSVRESNVDLIDIYALSIGCYHFSITIRPARPGPAGPRGIDYTPVPPVRRIHRMTHVRTVTEPVNYFGACAGECNSVWSTYHHHQHSIHVVLHSTAIVCRHRSYTSKLCVVYPCTCKLFDTWRQRQQGALSTDWLLSGWC